MRPYLWPATLGLVAGVAVFLIALGGSRLAPRAAGQPIADATTLSGLAANIVLLLVALLAVIVAAAAYREARGSNAEQQKLVDAQQSALAESRQALTAAAGQLADHRRLLDRSVAALDEQLKIV